MEASCTACHSVCVPFTNGRDVQLSGGYWENLKIRCFLHGTELQQRICLLYISSNLQETCQRQRKKSFLKNTGIWLI